MVMAGIAAGVSAKAKILKEDFVISAVDGKLMKTATEDKEGLATPLRQGYAGQAEDTEVKRREEDGGVMTPPYKNFISYIMQNAKGKRQN